jgi:16S rRNA (cytosine967-C5)-methyltransferase
MKYDNQLRYATEIIDTYKGGTPLHAWLKDYFRANKQMGSRDRKLLSTLVYSFYRLGHAANHLDKKDRIITGLFLCTDQPTDWLAHFNAGFNNAIPQPLNEKLAIAGINPLEIFPWKDELSPSVDPGEFCRSFLRQPDLFLRIRPGFDDAVRNKLNDAVRNKLNDAVRNKLNDAIRNKLNDAVRNNPDVTVRNNPGDIEFIPPATLRLPNGFKVEELFTPDKEIVIQDYSSQRVAAFLQSPQTPQSFWDACAASGGKSILAHDIYPDMDLTVSDIRESILANLRTRFQSAGIRKYHAFVADLTREHPKDLPVAHLVLADVPCTGSGTWGRTPEDLFFFDPRKIGNYQVTQRKILTSIAGRLEPGAALVYCTCSVFKKENEEMIAFLKESFHLQPEKTENLIGYPFRADTLFASRLSKL